MTSSEPAAGDIAQIERSSIRKNVSVMATAQAVTWILATVGSVLVPRYLGPETQGSLQLAGSLWAIAGVFTALGTAMWLQVTIARDQQYGLRMMAPVLTARSLAFAVATILLVGYIALIDADTQFVTFMVFAGVSSLLGLWAEVYNTAFMGLERMSTVAGLSVLIKLTGLGATVAVVVLDLGVYGILGIGLFFAALALVLVVWRFHRISRLDTTWWRSEVSAAVAGGLPYMTVALALVLYRQIDVLVIAQVAGERDLGWYSAADTLFGSLLFPTTIIMASVFPTLGRLHNHDQGEFRSLVVRIFDLLVLLSVPIGLGAAVVGEDFATLLFGDQYSGTGTVLPIFGLVTILTFATTFLATVSLAADRRRFVTTVLLVSAALTVPLDIVLVRWSTDRFDNGAIGGALAFVVTETLQFVVGLLVIAPYIVTGRWAWRTARVLAAGALMVAAVWPLRDQVVAVPIIVGAMVYPVAIVAFRALDDYQRSLIHDALDQIPRALRRSDR